MGKNRLWCLGHVFQGMLSFTKDTVDGNFVPKSWKPKPIFKPATKFAPKLAPKGKHFQLFKMRRQVGRASIPQHLMPMTVASYCLKC